MARTPAPWFRVGRGWYTTLHGKQIPLGVSDPGDFAAAVAALQQLLSRHTPPAPPPPESRTVADIVAAFLLDCDGRVRAITRAGYGKYLGYFAASFGHLHPGGLFGPTVEADARRRGWSSSTQNGYLTAVQTCLRWGGVELKLRKPAKESAGADSVIPEAVYARILRETRGDFHQLVRFLWHTGCRPSEARQLTADLVDWQAGTVRFRVHKTSGKGKQRVLYLTAAAAAVLAEQRDRHPAGHLFVGGRAGQPFTLHSLTVRFWRLSKVVGTRVSAYDFRHTWATRALAGGMPDAQVAACLGHSSTAMLWRHYSHLGQQATALKSAAERVSRPDPAA